MLHHARRGRRIRRYRADSQGAAALRHDYVAAKRDYKKKGRALVKAKGKSRTSHRVAYIEARGRYHKLGKALAKMTHRKPRDAKAKRMMRGA